MAAATRKPILIAGAGLASLLLARSLLRSSIPFIVFERDASLSFRGQGYRLRLSEAGLDAIEAVLGPEGFPAFWDKCGKTGGAFGFAAIDALTGENLPPEESPTNTNKGGMREKLTSRDGKTIGISRGDMRAVFLQGCEPHVRFSHHVVGYELTDNGVRAIFKDGSRSEEGELLVGGEGIYSKTATQVSDGALKVYDTGARGIHGQAPSTAFRGLGEGVWRISDRSKPSGRSGIITNVRPGPLDDPSLQFGWTMSGDPGVIQPPNNNFSIIGKPAADMARAIAADWHPRVKALVDDMDEREAAFWKITCSTPSGVPQWKNQPRVTVIGDAAHSMTPAAGIGANTACRDSELLGRLLRESGGSVDGGLTAEFEKQMRVYASEAVGISYGMATTSFGITIDEKTSPTVN